MSASDQGAMAPMHLDPPCATAPAMNAPTDVADLETGAARTGGPATVPCRGVLGAGVPRSNRRGAAWPRMEVRRDGVAPAAPRLKTAGPRRVIPARVPEKVRRGSGPPVARSPTVARQGPASVEPSSGVNRGSGAARVAKPPTITEAVLVGRRVGPAAHARPPAVRVAPGLARGANQRGPRATGSGRRGRIATAAPAAVDASRAVFPRKAEGRPARGP